MNIDLLPLILIAIINIVTFFYYSRDKKLAVRGERRISEKNLLTAAFIGGAFGAHAAMSVMRHKTKHTSFVVLIPLAELFWMIIIFVYVKVVILRI